MGLDRKPPIIGEINCSLNIYYDSDSKWMSREMQSHFNETALSGQQALPETRVWRQKEQSEEVSQAGNEACLVLGQVGSECRNGHRRWAEPANPPQPFSCWWPSWALLVHLWGTGFLRRSLLEEDVLTQSPPQFWQSWCSLSISQLAWDCRESTK